MIPNMSVRLALPIIALVFISIIAYHHKVYMSTKNLDEMEESILNATMGFERIIVLNLPSRTDHADWITISAAVSGLHVDFIDGVDGKKVLDKVLPYPADRTLGDGNIGSWRAHMNALAQVVRDNITTALILEDDADWDVRIKHQMRLFSRGTRALTQPLTHSPSQYADPSFLEPRPRGAQRKHPMANDDRHYDIYAQATPSTIAPRTSPYGDGWDVLWPGSCAMHFARAEDNVPHGRFILLDDDTMIPPKAYKAADETVLPKSYPPFTRIVHHVWDPVCTFAYAVSQQGARRILYSYGIKGLDRAFDAMMSDFCDEHVCLAVSPQLFGSYRPAGPVNRDSDINAFGQDKSTQIRGESSTENIQRSVRLNIEALLRGEDPAQLEDQFPAA